MTTRVEQVYREVADQVAMLSPEEWLHIKDRVTDSQRERTAVLLLDCCAKVMMNPNADRSTRMEAHQLHGQVTRWVWARKCERDWKGSPLMEVQ